MQASAGGGAAAVSPPSPLRKPPRLFAPEDGEPAGGLDAGDDGQQAQGESFPERVEPATSPERVVPATSPEELYGDGQEGKKSPEQGDNACKLGETCKHVNSFHHMVESHPANAPSFKPPPGVGWKWSSPDRTRLLFHATSAFDQIRRDGYRLEPCSEGTFGSAVYFADSAANARLRAGGEGRDTVVLVYSVYLGRQYVARWATPGMTKDWLWRLGMDSVMAPGDPNGDGAASVPEWAVFDTAQIEFEIACHDFNASSRAKEFAASFVDAASKSPRLLPLVDLGEALVTLVDQVVRSPHVSGLSWNDYQALQKGKGLTREQVREAYYRHHGRSPPPRKVANPWNRFQAEHAGKGYSKQEMLDMYHASQV